MRSRISRFLLVGMICFAWAAMTRAEMPQKPEGRVSDFAQILDGATETQILDLISRVENQNGAQMAVVTVAALDGLTVEEYANKLFALWGIGHKGKDDGVLFLVAPQERKMRIEVGYGLEGTINDGRAGRILDEAVIPFFKAGDFGRGILAGTERIAFALVGDESLVKTPAPRNDVPEAPKSFLGNELIVFLLAFFGLMIGAGFLAVGVGIRRDKLGILFGGIFGSVPLAIGIGFSLDARIPVYILPAWAVFVTLVGILFHKGIAKVFSALGSGGGGGSSGSSGSYGGGSSGGGGASRSW